MIFFAYLPPPMFCCLKCEGLFTAFLTEMGLKCGDCRYLREVAA